MNLLDTTRLAIEMQLDNSTRLAIDSGNLLLVDSGATMHDHAESTLSPAAIVDVAGPLPEGLLETLGTAQVPMLTRSYVTSSNGNVEHTLPELRSRHVIEGRGYMVYEASANATASRHSRPESFNDITRQHIGRPHCDWILRELQFPAPASGTPSLLST